MSDVVGSSLSIRGGVSVTLEGSDHTRFTRTFENLYKSIDMNNMNNGAMHA